jgi:hypothetical protein
MAADDSRTYTGLVGAQRKKLSLIVRAIEATLGSPCAAAQHEIPAGAECCRGHSTVV